MKKVTALVSAIFATSVVSMSAAIASPTDLTTSGQPASWKVIRTQPSATIRNQLVDVRDKGEVKSIETQAPAATTPTANRCIGDAKFATPPVVNNPHHLRNVVWRNMRAMCAN